MPFDALTLDCVADELRSTILGGRVQQALLPDAESIGLEVYEKSDLPGSSSVNFKHESCARISFPEGDCTLGE